MTTLANEFIFFSQDTAFGKAIAASSSRELSPMAQQRMDFVVSHTPPSDIDRISGVGGVVFIVLDIVCVIAGLEKWSSRFVWMIAHRVDDRFWVVNFRKIKAPFEPKAQKHTKPQNRRFV
jgi:hypothetical protein